MTGKAEQKSFGTPDETRTFERGTLDLLRIGDSDIGRLTLQPGWRWSEHVRPLAGTQLCEAPHFQYHVRGTLHVVMGDGTEFDARPGDVTALPQGHDAWVVGDEPVVVVDWWGASNYARVSKPRQDGWVTRAWSQGPQPGARPSPASSSRAASMARWNVG